jgi:tyrosyl-tRNA synthetase
MKIEELLTRGVANIISGKNELIKRIHSGEKLNIYLGIDPTATQIHLGHAVPLRKLQAFAVLGHHVTFLIGDFTALIGDTSDKDTERPVLTSEQIHENFQSYKKQAEKIIDFSLPNVTVKHNSEWLQKLSFEDIIKLSQHFAVGDFVGRELIRRRLQENKRVGLHELLYPVMQGYDSYHMDADIQIGGTDQTFNMQAGRTLQKDIRKKESFVLATEFLIGTDGKKMSKTGGNAIWLTDTPEDMYAKVMAVRDELIDGYFLLATNVSMEKVHEIKIRMEKGENPRDIKKELAEIIVSEFHGKDNAVKGAESFVSKVQNKEMPSEMPMIAIKESIISLIDLLLKTAFVASRAEAKRLIEQGGVTIDNEAITDASQEITVKDDIILKVGKRKFVKIQKEI